jgi:hypothetical protein
MCASAVAAVAHSAVAALAWTAIQKLPVTCSVHCGMCRSGSAEPVRCPWWLVVWEPEQHMLPYGGLGTGASGCALLCWSGTGVLGCCSWQQAVVVLASNSKCWQMSYHTTFDMCDILCTLHLRQPASVRTGSGSSLLRVARWTAAGVCGSGSTSVFVSYRGMSLPGATSV